MNTCIDCGNEITMGLKRCVECVRNAAIFFTLCLMCGDTLQPRAVCMNCITVPKSGTVLLERTV